MADIPKEIWAKILNTTLSVPPPGKFADLDNPKWHGQSVVAAAAVAISLMLVMSSIRIYAKCYLNRTWTLDDSVFLLSLSAALSLISLNVAIICGGGYGYHAWEVKVSDLTKPVLLRSLALVIVTGPLTWLIKLAVFSLIFHAFRPLTYVRRLVYGGLIVSGLYAIANSVSNGIACGPRGGTDYLSVLAGMAGKACGNPSGIVQIFSVTSGVVNFVVDFYLLVIPLRAISKLRLPTKQKIGVFFIFLTGIGACVMSIIMLVYRVKQMSHLQQTWQQDTTYTNVSGFTVAIIEYCVGIIIPCMPPAAKASKYASAHVSSYFGTRLSSFRRTKLSDESINQGRELPELRGKGPFVHVERDASYKDTIDRMLTEISPADLQREGGAYERV